MSLMIDEYKLETATRLLGAKTYSEAVNRALDEAINLIHFRGIASLIGHDVWSGDLGQMRKDTTSRRTKIPKKKK